MRRRVSFLCTALVTLAAVCLPLFDSPISAGGTAPATTRQIREGVLEVLFADNFQTGSSRILYELITTEGERILLRFEGAAPVSTMKRGDRMRVTGRFVSDALIVECAERLPGATAAETAAIDSAWTIGPKRAIAILVNFLDDTSQPYTVSQAQTTMFGPSGSNVASYFGEVSFGLTTISGDIAGWYTLPINKPTTCNPPDWISIQSNARTAATEGGWDLTTYQFEIYVFPRVSACNWAGLGVVGGPGVWINQYFTVFTTCHELGHNYGLWHAHSLDCGALPVGGTCADPRDSNHEYGDPYDIMGGGAVQILRHLNAYMKQRLEWLPPADVATLSSGSATFDLQPIESAAGLRAVRLSTRIGRTYWLEFRQAIGVDSSLSSNANLMNGTLFHIGPGSDSDPGSLLLDMTPDGSIFLSTLEDPALTVGNSFRDAEADLTVSTVAKTGSTLTVFVNVCELLPAPSASNNGPICAGQTLQLNAATVLGAAYSWTGPGGFTSTEQNPQILSAPVSASGTYNVTVTVDGCSSDPGMTTVVVNPLPSALIAAPSTVCPNAAGLSASVPSAGAGATYSWAITNGTITSGAGTISVTFTAGGGGSVRLDVTVTDANGCGATGTKSVPIVVGPSCGGSFYTLTPCRLIDTRNPGGPYGGPPLAGGTERTFVLTDACGIPPTAKAVAVNMAVTQPTGSGHLRIYPADQPLPNTAVINFSVGQTRANNAIVPLGSAGDITVHCGIGTGYVVDFVLDVTGYFE